MLRPSNVWVGLLMLLSMIETVSCDEPAIDFSRIELLKPGQTVPLLILNAKPDLSISTSSIDGRIPLSSSDCLIVSMPQYKQ